MSAENPKYASPQTPAAQTPTPQNLAATALQSHASDPALSAWVSANAGSGKTHVLARRVIRLLLRGVAPGRILCLTYTKAAAANMANRVLADLRRWASLDEATLDDEIVATDGGGRDPLRRARARQLFARALETPGGLKIQTIHAFCGALLHRFPFEAGVAAGFGELDEAGRAELLARVRAEVVLAAAAAPETALGAALAVLVDALPDGGIDALIAELTADPEALQASEADIAALVGAPGIASIEIAGEMVAAATPPPAAWRGLAEALMNEGGNAAARGRALMAAASAPEADIADLYARVFLKDDGAPRADAQFGAVMVRARYPALLTERDRLAGLAAGLAAARAAERSLAARTLGRAALSRYEAAKRARGVMDFADLVVAARRLLADGASAWVHYKLDQGIDHVLVDEAQDTSPAQWDVIRPLVAEFFAGAGAATGERQRPGPRTLFVVGDEKQSIFSFQGADPRRFDAMRREFAAQLPAADFAQVRLTHSFRSAPGILAAVDTVFARFEAHDGLAAEAVPTVHEPIHLHLPASIEIWEPEAPGPKVERDAWTRPLDAPGEDDPVDRLGRRLADHIAARLKERFPVARRDGVRAMRAGDVLVLVRRRGPLFEAIIRALKQAGVPVAGADRLVVAQHIAVMDLMALGDALLSPDDELALACALKSPLFGLDDDDLIALAAGRTGRLGEALKARAGERPHWQGAQQLLERLRPDALALRPFDFYARVLGRERARARLIARLGLEAADALDEMLALARAYERVETPSLPGFLAFLRRGGSEAKRDMEAGRDEVRVMTVHGAKGLEAPYVVLADTVGGPRTALSGGLLHAETADGRRVALLAPRKDEDTPQVAAARAAAQARGEAEYRRLLYVAMTRAETALVLCGAQGRTARPPGCWYDLVRAALEPEAVEVPATGFAGTVLRWRASPPGAAAPAAAAALEESADVAPLLRPLAMAPPPRRLLPSALGEDAPLSPGAGGGAAAALRRGALVHRLLAGLAGLDGAARAGAGMRLLAIEAADWPEPARQALLADVLAVLELEALAPLFGPRSRAEVPLAGVLDGVAITGRIDRLAVLDDHVLIADFKTDARPPLAGKAPDAHRDQIALYAGLVARLFPGWRIEGRLVYTAGPAVHALGAEELVARLARLTSP